MTEQKKSKKNYKRHLSDKDEKSYKNKRYYWYVHIHLHTTDLLHILYYTTRLYSGEHDGGDRGHLHVQRSLRLLRGEEGGPPAKTRQTTAKQH